MSTMLCIGQLSNQKVLLKGMKGGWGGGCHYICDVLLTLPPRARAQRQIC